MGHRRLASAVVAAGLLLTTVACSSSGGAQQETAAAGAGSAGTADTPQLKVAMITHGPAGDTFWDTIQTGARDAAAKDNIDLVYASDADGSGQSTLIENAVDQKVDGLVVTLNKGPAVKDAVARAVSAGIPVFAINGGVELSAEYGAIAHIGQDETLAGEIAGEKLAEAGYKKAICVSPEQGNSTLEQRCDGLKQGFSSGSSETLYVNGVDIPGSEATINAKLQQDPTIDVVFGLGSAMQLTAVSAVSGSNSNAVVAGIDANDEVLKDIKAGSIQFAIDQQPYLQGYEGVDSVWLYLNKKGAVLGGGKQILTGPSIIDSSNIDAKLAGTAAPAAASSSAGS